MQVKHAFTLLQFNIKMGLLNLINPYLLQTMTVRGGNTAGSAGRYGLVNAVNNINSIGYNLTAGAIQEATNTSAVYSQALSRNVPSVSLIATPITVYAFVLPGSYLNPVPAVKFQLSLLGIVSETAFTNLPSSTTLVAGTRYVYDVKIGGLLGRSTIQAELLLKEPLPAGETDAETP